LFLLTRCRSLELRVLAVDVLTASWKSFVGRFEIESALRSIARVRHYLLSGLWALVVVPWAPNLIAFRRVSSNFKRA